jgi:hypothetical protein
MGDLSPAEFLVAFTIGTTGGILVFLHADRNGSKHTTAWGIFVFFFFIVALPVYLIHVRRTRKRV